MGLGAATPHVVNGGSLVYEAGATTNVSVGGVAAQEGTMTATMLGGESSVTVSGRHSDLVYIGDACSIDASLWALHCCLSAVDSAKNILC